MSAELLTLAYHLAVALALVGAGSAPEECAAPFLVLDLDGNGLRLSDRFYPVDFDVDGDGDKERLSWTADRQDDAFLWLDHDGNGQADGREIFGAPRRAAGIEITGWGFEALAAFDLAAAGGNGDGLVSDADAVWRRLRLWIDRNHDAKVSADEVERFAGRRIEAISLDYEPSFVMDASLNHHRYWSTVMIIQSPGNIHSKVVTEVCFDSVSQGEDTLAEVQKD